MQRPVGLIITGDLIDNGYTEGFEVDNFTATYGLDGTDGLIHFPVYVSSHTLRVTCLPRCLPTVTSNPSSNMMFSLR